MGGSPKLFFYLQIEKTSRTSSETRLQFLLEIKLNNCFIVRAYNNFISNTDTTYMLGFFWLWVNWTKQWQNGRQTALYSLLYLNNRYNFTWSFIFRIMIRTYALAEGLLPCLLMAAKLLGLVPAGLMWVGRLWRRGRRRRIFVAWSRLAVGYQEYLRGQVGPQQ